MSLATLQPYEPAVSTVSLNLDHLTPQQQIDLHVLLTEVKSAIRRVENEFIFMASKLGMMQEILGENLFFTYVAANLKLPKHQVNRLLLANKALQTHLSDEDGRVDVSLASRFTQKALFMLAPVEDDGIINEVRSLASAGEKINEATLARVLDAHQSNNDARIAVAESAAEKARAELAKVKDRYEVEVLRLNNQVTASSDQLRKLAEQRAAMEEEIQTLTKQATVVTEKLVDKVPDGYASLDAAIADAQARLAAIEKQEKNAIKAAEQAQAKVDELTALANQQVAKAEEFDELRTLVERLLMRFPLAKIKGVVGTSDEQRLAITGMGNAMVELGTQLLHATAEAA